MASRQWLTPVLCLTFALAAILTPQSYNAQTAPGRTFYLSPSGSDSNPGSLALPWKTLTFGALNSRPGDTLLLRAGVYTDNEVWIRDARGMGGAPGQIKTIANYPGEQPILRSQNGIYLSASWIRIEGLKFDLAGVSSNTWDGPLPNNIQLVNNSFSGAFRGAAIRLVGDSLLVEGNGIALSNQLSDTDYGMVLHYGKNNTIRGNFVSGSRGHAIYVFDGNKSSYPAGAASGYDNILIEGNVVTKSERGSGIYISTADNFAVQNVTIRKNVINGHYAHGIEIRTGTGIKIQNNSIHDNRVTGLNVIYPATSFQLRDVTIENNIFAVEPCTTCGVRNHVKLTRSDVPGFSLMRNAYWPSSVSLVNATDSSPLITDPRFVNPGALDFHLQSNSSAIDAGIDIGLPFTGTAPDLGAFETEGSNPPAPPANSPPTVNAGANQTIALPAAATLSGTATDDGLPSGSTLTTTWSKFNGPGTVTFANTNALSTSASFSLSGTYVLNLTASDGALSSSSSVTVIVSSAPDTTFPLVSLTAPAQGATVSGSAVVVSGNASDNIGVVGVQFKVNGTNLDAEDTTPPYSVNWNTTTLANGSHSLTAVARDAAGNQTTSIPVSVTVNNVVVPPPPPPSGQSFYVSPSGSDTNNGSLASPWRTIIKALRSTGPGHTVYLRGGTYTETIEMRGDQSMGGSPSGWWTLQSYPGESATLSGGRFDIYSIQYTRIQGLNFINGAILNVRKSDWLNPPGPRAHHVEIRNNTFSGTQVRYGFIVAKFDNSLVEGNTITITGTAGTVTDHGIYLQDGDGNTLRGNIVSGASGYGIHVYDERKKVTDPQMFFNNIVVENNVLSNSRLRGGLILAQGGDTVVNSAIVRNNVTFGNIGYGIEVASYGANNINGVRVLNNTATDRIRVGNTKISGSEIRNNISLGGLSGLSSGVVASNNMTSGDPLFVNAAARDYHLRNGSPAINQGTTVTGVPADKDGIARPVGGAYDLGAYEYQP